MPLVLVENRSHVLDLEHTGEVSVSEYWLYQPRLKVRLLAVDSWNSPVLPNSECHR
jgi:hypothetical protein